MTLHVTSLKVQGMDCSDETSAIKKALSQVPGIVQVEPNIMASKVVVTHKGETSRQSIIKVIRATGVKVSDEKEAPKNKFLNQRTVIVGVSGALLLFGIVVKEFALVSGLISNASSIAAILIAGYLILPKALRAVRTRSLDMNVLMTVATIGAVVIGEYAEGAAVVFLFALAELLESLSLERARRSIETLMKIVPEVALRQKNGTYEEIAVEEVKIGDKLLVRSGSRIPLDGKIISGKSSVNQAPITGESLPVERGPNDQVFAGTINGEGSLVIEVTQGYQSTKIAQIIKLIEEAQTQRAPTQRFVDSFAKYYTPIVFALAVGVLVIPSVFLGGDWSTWVYRSLVLLVIACPCALVIATPVSIVSGLTSMARRGILMKGGTALESIGKLQALAVDKTGTITEGVPKVLNIHTLNGYTEEKVLAVAASIDNHSTHPLAKAIVNYARERKIDLKESTGYQATSGRGAEAVIEDHIFFVGNHRFAHDNAVCSEMLEAKLREMEDRALSVVIVAHRPHAGCLGEVMGVLGLGDAIRKDAISAIQKLKAIGLKAVVMLSGDNQRTVAAIAKQVGIDEAYADLLPSDKVLKIKELKEKFESIAMIGDGVNDAPAMASATLGIAMGASGTDTAIETSDVTLMKDSLLGVAEAIQMGRRTMRIIWFNTVFALATKLLFLVLSVLGFSSLWLAISADTGATLLVIANALRLLR